VTARLLRFGLVAMVPTVADVGLLVWLRWHLGWPLVVADAVAIALASAMSYVLHRAVTFRSDPFVRWVRMPAAFVGVAVLAGAVDVAVLRLLHAAEGFGSVNHLLVAKLVALSLAAGVRIALYRSVLLGAVRRTMQDRPAQRDPAPGSLRASVVVPAYREASRIAQAVEALRAALADLGPGATEIVVVDDGSGDGTADAALAAGADQVVVHPANRGKGAAVRSGVAAARGRTIAFTDADLSYSPDQVVTLVREVEAGWDVAIGNRRHPGTRTLTRTTRVRDLGSRIINLAASAVLLSHPHDTQCGLKAFRSDAARTTFGLARVDGFAFDIELIHLIERHELSLTDVPVRVEHSDRSTVRAARDGIRLLRDLWRIRHLSATGAYELPEVAAPAAGGLGADQ
jgi:dolichyl-phosphate beta-glucosyltransferase